MPRSVEHEVRTALLPILQAVNAGKAGAAELLANFNSFIRGNIPPGENRVPHIRQRIGWLLTGQLDKLEAVSERRSARHTTPLLTAMLPGSDSADPDRAVAWRGRAHPTHAAVDSEARELVSTLLRGTTPTKARVLVCLYAGPRPRVSRTRCFLSAASRSVGCIWRKVLQKAAGMRIDV